MKEALKRLGAKILYIYIPRGYAGKLQVLDVGINHLFKLDIREQYESFMRGSARKNFSIQNNALGYWIMETNIYELL